MLSTSTEQIRASRNNSVKAPLISPSKDYQEWSESSSCLCFPRLLEAIQHVNTHANVCNPALDSVLCTNRAATKHCLASLQCAFGFASLGNICCTAIACGLLDRILVLYRAALGSFCAGLDGDEKDDGEPSPLRVRLGAFAIEKSEQMPCARDMVAREIGKLLEVLQSYANEEQTIRSVLIMHLIQRYTALKEDVTS